MPHLSYWFINCSKMLRHKVKNDTGKIITIIQAFGTAVKTLFGITASCAECLG